MIDDTAFAPRGQTQDRSIPRFHMRAQEIPFKSAQEGRPIYEDREFVEIITPGNSRSMPVEPVNPEHIKRWPTQYEAFKRGQEEAATEGTPLEEFPAISPSMMLNFKGLHIKTVEQLALVTDADLQNMGTGARELRERARRYLNNATSTAPVVAAEARAQRAEAEVERLNGEISSLANRLQALEDGGRERRGPGRPPNKPIVRVGEDD